MLHLEAKKTLKMKPTSLKIRSGQVSEVGVMFLVEGTLSPGRSGGRGGLNVIVGCVPPLNDRT